MGKRGFTLVELVAVVIILGILMAVGIPQYLRAMERSRGAEAYSTLAALQEAEKIYNTEYESYTCKWATDNTIPPTTGLGVQVPGGANATGCPGNGIGVTGVSNAVGIRWNFSVNATSSTYLAAATRKAGGRCGGNTVTINEGGHIESNWENCVNGL